MMTKRSRSVVMIISLAGLAIWRIGLIGVIEGTRVCTSPKTKYDNTFD